MKPVILVRQLRFLGVGTAAGVVVAALEPWLGLAIVVACLALMVGLVLRFRHRG